MAVDFVARFRYYGDNSIFVEDASSDTERYTNLTSAYGAAKTLTPNGFALSASNRADVMIPAGTYDAGSSIFALNGDFVDLIALVPVMGGTDIGTYQPNNVIITGAPATYGHVVNLTADDIQLVGLSIVSTTADTTPIHINQTASSGDTCVYDRLYFWVQGNSIQNVTSGAGTAPDTDGGMTYQNIRGKWTDCVCSFSWAWRVNGWGTPTTAIFDADMKNCHAGERSYAGDCVDVVSWETKFLMENCSLENCIGGDQSFAGCGGWGCGIASTVTFTECEAGDNSYGMGSNIQGTLIRCRGGRLCAGSTTDDGYPDGEFSGYAEGCIFDSGSLGGTGASTVTETGVCSGTVVRCKVGRYEDFTQSFAKETHIEGAIIIDSDYFFMRDGFGVFTIGADGGSFAKIIGCNLQMFPKAATYPIDASVARDVIFAGCTVNNQANSATGLGANVTNKATTPANGLYNLT